jgi:hypothetical protein
LHHIWVEACEERLRPLFFLHRQFPKRLLRSIECKNTQEGMKLLGSRSVFYSIWTWASSRPYFLIMILRDILF